MKELSYFWLLFKITLARLCRQRWLLAGLVPLCLLLPLLAGEGAQAALLRGVEFSPVTLALTAPEGDGTPRLLEQVMGEMEDISQYCRFTALEEEQALEALESGAAAAVLVLPGEFIQGVMEGENPDLRLIVNGDRPLESLLLLWAGQSASDILSAFQSGVYGVLELYEQAPPPGLTREQVVREINLEYIRLALDREEMFSVETVSATRTLPVALHYALALLACFALSAAPLLRPLYTGSWMGFQRRLRAAGRGSGTGYFAALTAGAAVLLALLAPALAVLDGGRPTLLLAAAGMALWCSAAGGLLCLALPGTAPCGSAAFVLALAGLVLAGGLVPPALMPAGLRAVSWLSPVSWLMELAAWPMGFPPAVPSLVCLLGTGGGAVCLSLGLYRRRTEEEAGL